MSEKADTPFVHPTNRRIDRARLDRRASRAVFRGALQVDLEHKAPIEEDRQRADLIGC
jgi:hypothetical protein